MLSPVLLPSSCKICNLSIINSNQNGSLLYTSICCRIVVHLQCAYHKVVGEKPQCAGCFCEIKPLDKHKIIELFEKYRSESNNLRDCIVMLDYNTPLSSSFASQDKYQIITSTCNPGISTPMPFSMISMGQNCWKGASPSMNVNMILNHGSLGCFTPISNTTIVNNSPPYISIAMNGSGVESSDDIQSLPPLQADNETNSEEEEEQEQGQRQEQPQEREQEKEQPNPSIESSTQSYTDHEDMQVDDSIEDKDESDHSNQESESSSTPSRSSHTSVNIGKETKSNKRESREELKNYMRNVTKNIPKQLQEQRSKDKSKSTSSNVSMKISLQNNTNNNNNNSNSSTNTNGCVTAPSSVLTFMPYSIGMIPTNFMAGSFPASVSVPIMPVSMPLCMSTMPLPVDSRTTLSHEPVVANMWLGSPTNHTKNDSSTINTDMNTNYKNTTKVSSKKKLLESLRNIRLKGTRNVLQHRKTGSKLNKLTKTTVRGTPRSQIIHKKNVKNIKTKRKILNEERENKITTQIQWGKNLAEKKETNQIKIKEEITNITDDEKTQAINIICNNNTIRRTRNSKKSHNKESNTMTSTSTSNSSTTMNLSSSADPIESYIAQEWDENDECQEGALVKLKKPLTICYAKNGYNFCGLKTHRWHIRRSMGNRGKFVCLMKCCVSGQYCNKSFGQKCHWVRHCKERHVDNPVRFSCECCQKSYAQRESLLNHVFFHHEETVNKEGKYHKIKQCKLMEIDI